MSIFVLRANLVFLSTLALSLACSGSDEWPSQDHDAEIAVRVELLDPDATRIGVRVWNEEHELLRDELLSAGDFPRILRFFPREDIARGAPYRHVLVELELWGMDGCLRGRADRFIRYQPDRQERVELSLSADAEIGSCRTYYVDPDFEPEGPCIEAAPCHDIGEALFQTSDDGGASIVFVAGGHRYGSGRWSQFGQPRTPITVRAWPGRTLQAPQFEGDVGGERATIYATVFDDLVLDGLEILGGAPRGIALHRTTRGEVRHCRVLSSGDEAGIDAALSTGIRFFHNLVQNTAGPGIRAIGTPSGHDADVDAMLDPQVTISANLVRDNSGPGILADDLNGRLIAMGNTLCGNVGAGIAIEERFGDEPDLEFRNNAIIDNSLGFASGEYEGAVFLGQNSFVANAGGSIDEGLGDLELSVSDNVLFGAGAAPFASGNTLDDESAVSREGCFIRPSGRGVCEAFPNCP